MISLEANARGRAKSALTRRLRAARGRLAKATDTYNLARAEVQELMRKVASLDAQTTPRLDSGKREEVRRARDLQPWDDE